MKHIHQLIINIVYDELVYMLVVFCLVSVEEMAEELLCYM